MMPVPLVSPHDVNFGRGDYLPERPAIPADFFCVENPYNKLLRRWFGGGIRMSEIMPRMGINQCDGILAIKALLNYNHAPREHRIAGGAYLMSQWFYLIDDTLKT